MGIAYKTKQYFIFEISAVCCVEMVMKGCFACGKGERRGGGAKGGLVVRRSGEKTGRVVKNLDKRCGGVSRKWVQSLGAANG